MVGHRGQRLHLQLLSQRVDGVAGQLVGLVHHQNRPQRQDLVVAAQGAEAEQRVVGDDDIGRGRLYLGLLVEALVEQGALAAAALAMADGQALAQREGQPHLLDIARRHGCQAPLHPLAIVGHTGQLALAQQLRQPQVAQIVAAPLEQGHAERLRRDALQIGQILPPKLAHQRLVGGADHGLGPRPDHRRQVGEGFADAGAGLDHPVALLVEGVAHQLGHGDLALARPVALAQQLRHLAAGLEDLVHRWAVDGLVQVLAFGRAARLVDGWRRLRRRSRAARGRRRRWRL